MDKAELEKFEMRQKELKKFNPYPKIPKDFWQNKSRWNMSKKKKAFKKICEIASEEVGGGSHA